MRSAFFAVLATALLGACATLPPPPSTGTEPPAAGPAGPKITDEPIDLGDFASQGPEGVQKRFGDKLRDRYAVGLALGDIAADQARNGFTCAPSAAKAGDPPDQVCRKAVKAANCTHTFQTLLYDAAGDGKLARLRGLYDRVCEVDGLLGGPG